MAKLITVGEILTEIMATQVGQTFLEAGTFAGPYASGAPAIMISQAARLGADCAIIACVGQDDFGLLNLNRLRSDGVDVSGVKVREDQTTGVAFVGYAPDGSRKFIFHFTHAAAGALTPADIDPALFEDVRIFHIMGCSLSASDSLRDALIAGAKLAKEKNALISFDPNIRPELLKMEETRKVLSWILEECDILLTGKSELENLSGMPAEEAIELYRNKKYALIVKDGSRGTRVFAQGTEEHIPTYKVEEVDPTGAGDCFDGAFLASVLDGKSLVEAARIGSAAGALSVTKRGPMEGAAYMDAIEALMN